MKIQSAYNLHLHRQAAQAPTLSIVNERGYIVKLPPSSRHWRLAVLSLLFCALASSCQWPACVECANDHRSPKSTQSAAALPEEPSSSHSSLAGDAGSQINNRRHNSDRNNADGRESYPPYSIGLSGLWTMRNPDKLWLSTNFMFSPKHSPGNRLAQLKSEAHEMSDDAYDAVDPTESFIARILRSSRFPHPKLGFAGAHDVEDGDNDGGRTKRGNLVALEKAPMLDDNDDLFALDVNKATGDDDKAGRLRDATAWLPLAAALPVYAEAGSSLLHLNSNQLESRRNGDDDEEDDVGWLARMVGADLSRDHKRRSIWKTIPWG